jgi:type IV pilus assembly protein PilA
MSLENPPGPTGLSSTGRHRFLRGAAIVAILIGVAIWGWFSIPRYPIAPEEIATLRLRTLRSAQEMYKSIYPSIGYACSLSALGGDTKVDPPSPLHAQILRPAYQAEVSYGYKFAIRDCKQEMIEGRTQVTAFEFTAIPQVRRLGSKRGFCIDQTGMIKVDPSGGSNCTRSLDE